jgi:hypothetical protein
LKITLKLNRDKSITELHNKTESYTTASLDLMFVIRLQQFSAQGWCLTGWGKNNSILTVINTINKTIEAIS